MFHTFRVNRGISIWSRSEAVPAQVGTILIDYEQSLIFLWRMHTDCPTIGNCDN